MSSYDHMSKPGYVTGRGSRTYVSKVETYVEGVRRPAGGAQYKHTIDHGRPPQVDELLDRILMEVNEPPAGYYTDPSWDTSMGHHIMPVKVGAKDDYIVDHEYVSSPRKLPPSREHGPGYMYGVSPTKSDVPRDFGGHPPQRGHRGPDHQWDGPSSPVYGHPPEKGYGLRDDQWRDHGDSSPRKPGATGNGWSGSPRKPIAPYEYPLKPENSSDYKSPNSQWGGSPLNSRASGDYGVPNNQWEGHSPKDQSLRGHKSPKDHGVPETQWGYRPSGPTYARSPNPQPAMKPETLKDRRAPNDHWGSSPAKEAPKDFGHSPDNPWGSSYDHTPKNQPLMKPETLKGNRVPDKPWGGSPANEAPKDFSHSPDNRWGSSYDHAPKPETLKGHGVSDKPWGSSTVKPEPPRNYGYFHDDQPPNNQSKGPYDHSPLKPELQKDHGVARNHWGGSSPLKTNTVRDHGAPEDHWDGSLSPVYSHRPPNSNPEHQQPPSITCEDGVCTFNDKPKASHKHSTFDEPTGSNNSYSVNNHVGYSDDEPKNYVRANGVLPSGYVGTNTPPSKNIGVSLGQLSISGGDSPKRAAGRSSSPATPTGGRSRFSVPPSAGLKREGTMSPVDIDSREAARRYGGYDFPPRMDDQKRTISSKEALEKYNGSTVPK